MELPTTAYDQEEVIKLITGGSDTLPDDYGDRLDRLAEEVEAVITLGGLRVLCRSSRLKDRLSLDRKLSRYDPLPVCDMYGVRLVLDSPEDCIRGQGLLQGRWPTPEMFPLGATISQK